jgi:hypothetical protein
MTQPKSFEVLYQCSRETGLSREYAEAGAKAVLASSKVMTGTCVPQVTDVGGNPVDCSTESNQFIIIVKSYYKINNSKQKVTSSSTRLQWNGVNQI